MSRLINRISLSWLRLRHTIATGDLAWMERRAPQCLADQRARVNQLTRELLRRELDVGLNIDADTVRHQVERRAKQRGMQL